MFPGHLRKPGILVWLLTALLPGRAASAAESDALLPLVPWPREVERMDGELPLEVDAAIVFDDPVFQPAAEVLAAELALILDRDVSTRHGSGRAGDICLVRATPAHVPLPCAGQTAYELVIDDRVSVTAEEFSGLSLGTATLLQLLQIGEQAVWPRVRIADGARFAYNGAVLDVARKPYTLDDLRTCVDICRFYKIRYLQLHLTDENAWTLPSRAFPLLGSQNFAWAGGSAPAVYPRDELAELIAYADQRGVTFVPEIEVPGHSGQLRGTYPEIFGIRDAEGNPVPLGVSNFHSEAALSGLAAIIEEACELFASSPYIHIGCDEASLGGVPENPEVQARLRELGEDDIHALFQAMIVRLHDVARDHHKQLIVWEGAPLAPHNLPGDIVFMPWIGGTGAAAEMTTRGHAVINAPWGIDGPLLDPFLVNGARFAAEDTRLLGATSLLWEAEARRAADHLRFTGALRSEMTHHPADRDYLEVFTRLAAADARLDRLLFGFALEGERTIAPQTFMALQPLFAGELTLHRAGPCRGTLRYTLDGSAPTANSPELAEGVVLDRTATVHAQRFDANSQPLGAVFEREYRRVQHVEHAAVGSQIVAQPETAGYPGPGLAGLVDGYLAAGYDLDKPGWRGWVNTGQPLVLTMELPASRTLHNLSVHCLRSAGGVTIPQQVRFLSSEDGQDFVECASVPRAEGEAQRGWFRAEIEPQSARYLRLEIAHGGDWTFIDEVCVNTDPLPRDVDHLAVGCQVTLAHQPNGYVAAGPQGLTDGFESKEPSFLSLEWLGFELRPFEATVDLGQRRSVGSVEVRFLQDMRAGISIPQMLRVAVSADGEIYQEVAVVERPGDEIAKYVAALRAEFPATSARFVRVTAPPAGIWIFADEIHVNGEAN